MKRHAACSVALLYITVLIAGTALAGCERQIAAPTPAAPLSSSAGTDPATDTVQGTSPKDAMHVSSISDPQVGSVPSAATAGGTTPAASKPVGKSEADQAPPPPKPRVDAKDAYQEKNPTLLGLTLRSPKDNVLARLGAAKNTFVMDDDTDPVTVYEYADFSVGFNKNNTLEFVDIRSSDIDPGLHGLRLGQKSENAVKALGKPDTSSPFVLTYKSQGTILKLDLDPKNATIRSIKLFASK